MVVVLVSAYCVLQSFTSANAGELDGRQDGTVIWKAGLDGVEIEWGADGQWNRIYSQYSHTVAFPDRQGIAKAYIIAEEKAKANIIRYLNQNVTSGRMVAEIQNDMNQSTQEQVGDNKGSIEKTKQRTLIENLTELTGSVASGNLQGVIVLERGYDEPREEVWVKVGLSRRSMGAARSLQKSLSGQTGDAGDSHDRGGGSAGGGEVQRPGSEVQRLEKDDW